MTFPKKTKPPSPEQYAVTITWADGETEQAIISGGIVDYGPNGWSELLAWDVRWKALWRTNKGRNRETAIPKPMADK